MNRGFALIASISIMSLLVMITLAMLTLSSKEAASSRYDISMSQARANARMALMIAIAELQEEMGPDMRISAEAALFDTDEQTEAIDGVDQSRWMASYNSWGNWLNADYTLPNDGSTLDIQDTYVTHREPMFRRWLVSLPTGMENDVRAPLAGALNGWDSSNSVILVGKGSLGDSAQSNPDQITRGYLTPTGDTGRIAWWIGPENHKANANLSKKPRTLDPGQWEVSQGDTAEVGVGALDGFSDLDNDPTLSGKILSRRTLRSANVTKDKVQQHFFDLTSTSKGVIASVRTGHLKKDLSLLFENSNSAMPSLYQFNPASDVREPSIRPMSAELQSKNAKVPGRHFASWTNMRHYYRMYRNSSDASVGGTGGRGALDWSGSQPSTDITIPTLDPNAWNGSNNYLRMPVLAKITFIYSLQSEPNSEDKTKYDCYLVYTPIYTFWNPYNVELKVNDNALKTLASPYKILPLSYFESLNNVEFPAPKSIQGLSDVGSAFRSDDGSKIAFKPGELKMFSYRNVTASKQTQFYPGFDPQAIGGDKIRIFTKKSPSENPGMSIAFGNPVSQAGNVWFGNTPGSLNIPFGWEQAANSKWLPAMYQHDWFQNGQNFTRITPKGSADVAKWVFSDNDPVPFAFNQLVIKTSSQFDYESIDWAQDWRSRNWLQAPPFYFGSSQFISEDDEIAHTQRMDNPYAMHFGPMSAADMPKVVPHLGDRSFLGSGSSPHEKVTAAAMLELPTAPIASIAGFSNMRINPGWTRPTEFLHESNYQGPWNSESSNDIKAYAYQSGVTGPGIGNSFIHPVLPREDVYRFFDNTKSLDLKNGSSLETVQRDNQVFNDYWDHVFLLNDALWDDYFVSSLADQTRPGATSSHSLSENLDRLVGGESLANERYSYHAGAQDDAAIKAELQAADGYLKAAKHLLVDGMFNVNSTSVPAWNALFLGIRERQLVSRSSSNGLQPISVPSGKRISISRFNTEISNLEMDDPESGATLPDGTIAWTGVRFLDDAQLKKLAEECVKQVKQRGPFLNYSEFINRRLSDDDLGSMGALQCAIDYDDDQPESTSINYRFKESPSYMITEEDLGAHSLLTPEAAIGSRFAGIPGYVIQSDLLKPISNTLAVRDDTFRIRAYGEARDRKGNVLSKAWCESIVQRMPEYTDETNSADVSARTMDSNGRFSDNPELSNINKKYGRKLQILSFRWLKEDEV